MGERKNMRVTDNFHNLIGLLAESLYTTSDVFIRELVQNGHDGIIRRQARKEPDYQGEIHINCNTSDLSISFKDNGEGMDGNDIENFLSVIGSARAEQSREELGEAVSLDLIGQFGIGILSAFAAGSSISLNTRKVDSATGFQWVNEGSMEYTLSGAERDEPGTTVTVKLKPSFTWLLDEWKLKDLLIRYCDFIAVPVYLNGDGPVNIVYAPWDKGFPPAKDEETAYRNLVARRFPDRALEVRPLRIDVQENGALCRVQGVLYVPNLPVSKDGGTIDIFIRRMLVKERDSALLPSWAGFLRGIVDSPDLRPNTGRDDVNRESAAYRILQRQLEEVALAWMIELAADSEAFERVSRVHGKALKSLALVNERFFGAAAGKLRFPTSAGELSLEEYLSRTPPRASFLASPLRERRPIRYYTRHADAGSYERIAREKEFLIIRATDPRDAELLEMYAMRHAETELERFDGLDKRLFRELSREGRTRYAALESRLTAYLRDNYDRNAGARAVRFAPAAVPADIVESDDNRTDRELRERLDSPALDSDLKAAFEPLRKGRKVKLGGKSGLQLALNADNSVIQSLAELAQATPEPSTLPGLLSLLWHNALLYADRARDEATRTRLHGEIVQLMDACLNRAEPEPSAAPQAGNGMETLLQQNAALLREIRDAHTGSREEVAALREDLLNLRGELREQARRNAEKTRPDYITLFMITPFKDEYKPIRDAVKHVFACAPFCFEVQIATDSCEHAELRENIRLLMDKAHGFVAEISEQNANVMIEVGAVLMSDDERFLFPLEIRPRIKPELADIKGLLTFAYPGLNATQDEIEESILSHIYKEGEIIHNALKKLIATQRKALYLSDALLEKYSRLSGGERQKLLEELHPHTVEAFLDADTGELAKATEIDPYLLTHAQKNLREVKRKCDKYGR